MPYTRKPRRAAMRNAMLLALFSTLLGPVPSAHAADPQATHPLAGRWKVASINGAPPPGFLSGQVLVIQADAQLINIDLKASQRCCFRQRCGKGPARCADARHLARRQGTAVCVEQPAP